MKRIMQYLMMITMIILISTPAWAQTEEGFTVSGEVTFPKTGNLFIKMMTAEEFNMSHEEEEDEQREPKTEARFHAILEVREQEAEQKKVTFEFEHVPAGTYGIMCFQDVNGNEKLDSGMFGPKEPWGSYRHKRPHFRGPKFEEIKFDVKENMTAIQFKIE